jgi:hypothetical protein
MKMKLTAFSVFFIVFSCTSTSLFSQQKNDTATVVEYVFTSEQADDLFIFNYNGEDQKYLAGTGQSGWTYSFLASKKPFTALLVVNYSDPTKRVKRSTVTLNIKVNGFVVEKKTVKLTFPQTNGRIQYIIR